MSLGTQNFSTSSLLDRPAPTNESFAREAFLLGKFPAGLDNSLKVIANSGTGAAFSGMTDADKTAVLTNLKDLSEMEQLMIEDGLTPAEIKVCLGNHARTEMGLTVSNDDLDLLMSNYNRSDYAINRAGDAFVPRTPIQIAHAQEQATQDLIQGQITRATVHPDWKPITADQVQDYAEDHGLNPNVLRQRLASAGVVVTDDNNNNRAPSPMYADNIPGVGTAQLGATMALTSGMMGT
jgi:hypothetical protein